MSEYMLPEFDGMKIARKWEGWVEEFLRFLEYSFGDYSENEYGLAPYVYAQLMKALPKYVKYDKEKLADFIAYLKEQILSTWGTPVPNLNYEPVVPFLVYVFFWKHLQNEYSDYLKKIKKQPQTYQPYPSDPDEILDPFEIIPKEYADHEAELCNKIIDNLNRYLQDRINGTDFPDDNEIMSGVQLYWLYTDDDWINEGDVGLIALKQATLKTIADDHSEQENTRQSPEERLDYWYEKSKEALIAYQAQNALGKVDPGTGEFDLGKIETGVNFENVVKKMVKGDAWYFICPVRSPEALNDLLQIPFKRVKRKLNLYLNFIVDVIFPEAIVEERGKYQELPKDF